MLRSSAADFVVRRYNEDPMICELDSVFECMLRCLDAAVVDPLVFKLINPNLPEVSKR